ncbi:MAG: ATP-binding protein [Lonepinella koalarum]|nr:ATP-binding protein [Lonepinella koalarum]
MDKNNSLLTLKIKNLKSIENLEISIPLRKGLFILCGENGLGKSTLFSVLSKLVYKGAFTSYFRNTGNTATCISFEYNGKVDEWIKNPNWRRINNNQDEIFLKGFYEGSFIFGNRFSDANKELLKNLYKLERNPQDLVPASDFVIKNLGVILKNDKEFYTKLKKIKSKNKSEIYGFKNIPYFWEVDDNLIFQMSMSSGEYLLLNLLHFIDEKINFLSKNNNNNLSLIILDEIEMALHPSAQKRLTDFLQETSQKYNLCIYCATHSTQMFNKINPHNIFYLEKSFDNSIRIINPCYPAYITRDLYINDGFDYIILVEDRLAKLIIERALKRISSNNVFKLIHVIPCGGWEKTLELQDDFVKNKMAGQNCQIASILDADIKDNVNNGKWKVLNKRFLPIDSIEKYLKKHLIDEFNQNLYDDISNIIYISRSLKDILNDYKKNYSTDTDTDGKKLYKLLQSCANDIGMNVDKFNNDICDIILKNIDCSKFERSLKSLLDL